MSYLALARKWRPRTFADVVGQAHIVRALSNALTTGRVHHAFLFSGTRGVGKTTVARILARCLNCEQGVSAAPCGSCKACVGIEEGRFVDLIEVDAASRTGVDDIRELLDNVQYTPAAGRYKVYLIDEVHMLSKPAFNALLKTLEEPPPHVKFLFATTDPERLPVTVLSRCLQFNLKRLPQAAVVDRMAKICAAEGIDAEPAALGQLARAGEGSMRDSLSLLDQALAFGDGQLIDKDVAEMLGTMDRSRVLGLLARVATGDARGALDYLREIDQFVPDYRALLADMALNLQQVAVLQVAGADALEDVDALPDLQALATKLDAETTQLCYEIAVRGRRDIELAPDPRLGFEMLVLRMIAFRSTAHTESPPTPTAVAGTPGLAATSSGGAPVGSAQSRRVVAPMATGDDGTIRSAADWMVLAGSLGLEGAARQLAMHCALIASSPGALRLGISSADSHLHTEQLKNKVAAAVRRVLGTEVRVSIETHEPAGDVPTVAALDQQRSSEELRRARSAIESDPNVLDLTRLLGAQVLPESIKPVQPTALKPDTGSH